MKYSELFGKTRKITKNLESKNATLLIKAGFIDQTISGVYKFLPLGYRVLKKIEKIIREEMDKIAQEMLLTVLAPKEFYQKTQRDNIDVLFEAKGANKESLDKNDTSYFLNLTLEDNITPMVQQFVRSYREFPIALYQIQVKFRNEKRAKSGLLRCREFIMKDLYSFHTSKQDLEKYYEIVKESYMRIFNKLGLNDLTYITLASGGDFTDNYTHEFQVKADVGEDLVFRSSNGVCYNKEIAPCKSGLIIHEDELKELKKKFTPNIKTVTDLSKFLNVPVHKCVKTLVYIANGNLLAVALRGDYEVNELKIKKILNIKKLELATQQDINNIIGTEPGYIGILNLPSNIQVIYDDSLENLQNFNCGANEINYHYVNVNWDRDIQKPNQFYDIKVAKRGDLDPETNQPYEVFNAIEIGNIFQLDTKFSSDFNFKFVDKDGTEKLVYMGSYGIGVSRLIGVIAEVFADQYGLRWPEIIAPYKYHIVTLSKNINDNLYQKSLELYSALIDKGIEALWDDRLDVSFGEKLKDADLIGIPNIIIFGNNFRDNNQIELKNRFKNEIRSLSMQELLDLLNSKND